MQLGFSVLGMRIFLLLEGLCFMLVSLLEILKSLYLYSLRMFVNISALQSSLCQHSQSPFSHQ